jgi:hypothetical protein
MVAISCVAAVVLVGVGTYELARAGGPTWRGEWTTRSLFVGSWKHVLPAVWMATLLGLCALPPTTTTRWIRLAVLLPMTHALALVVALAWLPKLDLRTLAGHAPYVEQLPVLPWLGSGLGLVLVLAWVIGGRREWTHAFVMLALAFLLLFGLWLPIASLVPVHKDTWGWSTGKATLQHLTMHPASTATLVMLPPFLVATIYTVIAIRLPQLAQRLRLPILIALIVLCMAALTTRANASAGAFAVHDNFMHLLLAAVMLAIIATVTLSLSTWLTGWLGMRRLARDKQQREFAISDDDPDAIATMEITGFLRGPRVWTRAFIASDGKEELRVPSGARLVTAIPKLSSVMRPGEQVVVVTKRDRLRLGGLVASEVGDSPFRSHKITELGPNLIVARAEPISTPVESMLLTAWRPSIAYLVILVVVAIPSLLGVLVEGSR